MPVPDLALVVPTNDTARTKLEALGSVTLDFGVLDEGQDASIAGYGVFDFKFSKKDYKLRTGLIKISDVSDDYYHAEWNKNSSSGAISGSGDSGGPLFLKQDGNIKQFGVCSSGRFKTENGNVVSKSSTYSKLDHPDIRKWIESKTKLTSASGTASSKPSGNSSTGSNDVKRGVFLCKVDSAYRPYFVFEIDLNDKQSIRILEQKYSSSTTEERPTQRRWRSADHRFSGESVDIIGPNDRSLSLNLSAKTLNFSLEDGVTGRAKCSLAQ